MCTRRDFSHLPTPLSLNRSKFHLTEPLRTFGRKDYPQKGGWTVPGTKRRAGSNFRGPLLSTDRGEEHRGIPRTPRDLDSAQHGEAREVVFPAAPPPAPLGAASISQDRKRPGDTIGQQPHAPRSRESPACQSRSLYCASGKAGGGRGLGKSGTTRFRALIGFNLGGGATWAERAPAPPSLLGCSLPRASCVASSPASSVSERRLGAARSALPPLQPTTHVSPHLSGNCSHRDP